MIRLILTFFIISSFLSAKAQIGGIAFWNNAVCDPLYYPTAIGTQIAGISNSGWTATELSEAPNIGSGLIPLSDLSSGYRGRVVNTFRSKETPGEFVRLYPETITNKIVTYEVLTGPPLSIDIAQIVFYEFSSSCGSAQVTVDYFPRYIGSDIYSDQNVILNVLADDLTGNYFYAYSRRGRPDFVNEPVIVRSVNKSSGASVELSKIYPGGSDYFVSRLVFAMAGSGSNRYLYTGYYLFASGSSRTRVGIDRYKAGSPMGASEVVLDRPLFDVSTDYKYPALTGGDDNYFYLAARLGSGIIFYVYDTTTNLRVSAPSYPGEWYGGYIGRLIPDPTTNRLYESRGIFYFNRSTKTWHKIF